MSSTKLIRHGMDRVAPPPEGTSQTPTTDRALIVALLVAKGHEELQEVATSRPRSRERLRELADLYEVLYSLARMDGFTIGMVHAAASEKADERGPLLMEIGGETTGIIHRVLS